MADDSILRRSVQTNRATTWQMDIGPVPAGTASFSYSNIILVTSDATNVHLTVTEPASKLPPFTLYDRRKTATRKKCPCCLEPMQPGRWCDRCQKRQPKVKKIY
jgi:hypothetical protein